MKNNFFIKFIILLFILIFIGTSLFSDDYTKELIFEDTFNDNRNEWAIDGSDIYIENGKYTIYSNTEDRWSWMSIDVKDAKISAKTTWSGGKDVSAYGLIFRVVNPNQFYYFWICAAGGYQVGYVDGGIAQKIIDWKLAYNVKKGENIIEVEYIDTTITGYVNGEEIFSINNSKFNSGGFGFFSNKGVHAKFDDIKVWKYSKSSVVESGKRLLIEDNFNNNSNGWYISSDIYIENGQYHIFNETTNRFSYKTDLIKNGRIKVNTIWSNGEIGYGYGLLFRLVDDTHFYYFMLAGAGYYCLGYNDGDNFTNIINWTQSDIIRVQGENVIEVEFQEDIIIGYINGERVFSKSDAKYSAGGFGFFVSKNIHAIFDDITVWVYSDVHSKIEFSLDDFIDEFKKMT